MTAACPACGAPVSGGRFCGHCGTDLSSTGATSPQQTSPMATGQYPGPPFPAPQPHPVAAPQPYPAATPQPPPVARPTVPPTLRTSSRLWQAAVWIYALIGVLFTIVTTPLYEDGQYDTASTLHMVVVALEFVVLLGLGISALIVAARGRPTEPLPIILYGLLIVFAIAERTILSNAVELFLPDSVDLYTATVTGMWAFFCALWILAIAACQRVRPQILWWPPVTAFFWCVAVATIINQIVSEVLYQASVDFSIASSITSIVQTLLVAGGMSVLVAVIQPHSGTAGHRPTQAPPAPWMQQV